MWIKREQFAFFMHQSRISGNNLQTSIAFYTAMKLSCRDYGHNVYIRTNVLSVRPAKEFGRNITLQPCLQPCHENSGFSGYQFDCMYVRIHTFIYVYNSLLSIYCVYILCKVKRERRLLSGPQSQHCFHIMRSVTLRTTSLQRHVFSKTSFFFRPQWFNRYKIWMR